MLNYRYTIFSGFFQFLIPIIIITFIYLKILLFLKVKSTLSNSFDLVKFSVTINLNEILFEMNVKKLEITKYTLRFPERYPGDYCKRNQFKYTIVTFLEHSN